MKIQTILKIVVSLAFVGCIIWFFTAVIDSSPDEIVDNRDIAERVEEHFRAKEFREIISLVQSVDTPDDPLIPYYHAEAHFGMAVLYDNLFKLSLDDQIEYYENVVENNTARDNSVIRPYFIGIYYFEYGDMEKALNLFNHFLRNNPPDILAKIAQIYTGAIHFINSNISRAETIWNRIAREERNNPIIYNYLVRISLEAGSTKFTNALQAEPPADFEEKGILKENFLNLSGIYFINGDLHRAADMLDKYDYQSALWVEHYQSENDPDLILPREFYLPTFYRINKQIHYYRALQKYSEIKEKYPDFIYYMSCLYKIGLIHYQKHEYGDALEEWNNYLTAAEQIELNVYELVERSIIEERIKKCRYVLQNERIDLSRLEKSSPQYMDMCKNSELAMLCWELEIDRNRVNTFFNEVFSTISNIDKNEIKYLSDEDYEFLMLSAKNASRYFLDLKINDKKKAHVILRKVYEEGSQFSIETNDHTFLFSLTRAFLESNLVIGLSLQIMKEFYNEYNETFIALGRHELIVESIYDIVAAVDRK